jgi:hypothetical protein
MKEINVPELVATERILEKNISTREYAVSGVHQGQIKSNKWSRREI